MNENTDPTYDGQITRYISPEAKRSGGQQQRQVVFVNGMNNWPRYHRQGAMALSSLLRGTVYGCYNLKGGTNRAGVPHLVVNRRLENELANPNLSPDQRRKLEAELNANDNEAWWADMDQCMADQDMAAVFLRKKPIYQRSPKTDRWRHITTFLQRTNPCTLSLFKHLCSIREQHSVIVCHSQGNLITTNALLCLWLVHDVVPNVTVFALASPAKHWVPGLRVREYMNVNDVVPYLSAMSMEGRIRKSGAHATYGVQPDPNYSGNPTHDLHLYLVERQFLSDLQQELAIAP